MGQSRPTVRTTDQSKARRLGAGTGFFSTHELTVCTTRVVSLGNLAALKLPLPVQRKSDEEQSPVCSYVLVAK